MEWDQIERGWTLMVNRVRADRLPYQEQDVGVMGIETRTEGASLLSPEVRTPVSDSRDITGSTAE